KLKEKELQKLVESKKREAIEAKREKERIKAQIEQDRRDRIEREQRSKPSLSTTPSTTLTKPTDPSSVFASSTRASATTSKLQIRIPGATTLIETFQATDLLSQVYQCLESKGYSSASTGGSLATTYPRKVFTSEDRHKSLKELGLVPSNVLLFQP
ncbi:UBX domain-containing protein 1, partial [Coelomomyces lativittatus]